ncbi:MAG: flavin reductase [Thermoclostridium sp.]|nr:flavin reductase [Thermoclostridium sp.]
MENQFIEMKPAEITDNPFKLIGTDWMLITAGNMNSWNTMTASWGGLGFLWNRNAAICFVRPSRHTYSFMENNKYFTLSFFDSSYRKALNYCGSHSGREYDKAAETGLTPIAGEEDFVYFEQARLVLVCEKLYSQDFDPARFTNPELIAMNYPLGDYHRMYAGGIISCLKKEEPQLIL